MVRIPLSKGYEALVDDCDSHLLDFKWSSSASKDGSRVYAVRYDLGRPVKMHRVIMGLTDAGIDVDHIDGNTLNNTRTNLRIATRSQNSANRAKHRGGSSMYKGVFWHKVAKCWCAKITHQYKTRYLGIFEREEDAARAYDCAAKQFFGEFARVNFNDQ